jgi:hypothetical protein
MKLDTLTSYDPLSIIDAIYRLLASLDFRALIQFLIDLLFGLIPGFAILLLVATLFFLSVIIYCGYHLFQYHKADEKVINAVPLHSAPSERSENTRWLRVSAHADSENQSDWRLAILEADIILGDMLDKMGYKGETIGDKLKSIEKSDFLSLDDAWAAHRVRNVIAHEGAEFVLTQREARRVIDLYKKVFEEFKFI